MLNFYINRLYNKLILKTVIILNEQKEEDLLEYFVTSEFEEILGINFLQSINNKIKGINDF